MSLNERAQALRDACSRTQRLEVLPIGSVHAEDDMARADVQKVEPGYELACPNRKRCARHADQIRRLF